MAKQKTDSDKEAEICQLRIGGLTRDQIVERTGISKGTVKDILKRNGIRKSNPSSPVNHAHTRANIDESIRSEPNPIISPSMNKADGINPNLTQINTSNEIIQYVQFFRSRTKRLPYTDLSPHDIVWAEGNYGKRWSEGIRMMIDTTGLSAESLLAAVDDYEIDVADALERFNSKFRKDKPIPAEEEDKDD